MVFLDLLGRRWVLRLLWEFQQDNRLSFNELQERCEQISSSVLSQRLRDLRDAALLELDDRGNYVLTQLGRDLRKPLRELDRWTKRWAKELKTLEK